MWPFDAPPPPEPTLFESLTAGLLGESPPPPPPPLFEALAPMLVTASGWVGFAMSLLLTQMPTARSIAVTQTCANLVYFVHFMLLGAVGGAASQVVGMVNGLLKYNAAIPACKKLQKLLPVVLAPLGYLTCSRALDLLPLAAIGGRMLAFQATDVQTMRWLAIVAMIPWIPYSVAVESNSSLLTCFLSMGLTLLTIVRHSRASRLDKAAAKKTK